MSFSLEVCDLFFFWQSFLKGSLCATDFPSFLGLQPIQMSPLERNFVLLTESLFLLQGWDSPWAAKKLRLWRVAVMLGVVDGVCPF